MVVPADADASSAGFSASAAGVSSFFSSAGFSAGASVADDPHPVKSVAAIAAAKNADSTLFFIIFTP